MDLYQTATTTTQRKHAFNILSSAVQLAGMFRGETAIPVLVGIVTGDQSLPLSVRGLASYALGLLFFPKDGEPLTGGVDVGAVLLNVRKLALLTPTAPTIGSVLAAMTLGRAVRIGMCPDESLAEELEHIFTPDVEQQLLGARNEDYGYGAPIGDVSDDHWDCESISAVPEMLVFTSPLFTYCSTADLLATAVEKLHALPHLPAPLLRRVIEFLALVLPICGINVCHGTITNLVINLPECRAMDVFKLSALGSSGVSTDNTVQVLTMYKEITDEQVSKYLPMSADTRVVLSALAGDDLLWEKMPNLCSTMASYILTRQFYVRVTRESVIGYLGL
eukprot:gnl/Dysnectes_brevis/9393_a17405_222.p1 GENE.gnl/Dysnectes_brevis/9393_a17405_222~~gnl/Dysnectes_brevis/9393_a17405_222.p1  ORF type:complete len:366 (+),score=29.65 gnl/Dysnectes_brevis/9393_a17405_222:99-1100(+)